MAVARTDRRRPCRLVQTLVTGMTGQFRRSRAGRLGREVDRECFLFHVEPRITGGGSGAAGNPGRRVSFTGGEPWRRNR